MAKSKKTKKPKNVTVTFTVPADVTFDSIVSNVEEAIEASGWTLEYLNVSK